MRLGIITEQAELWQGRAKPAVAQSISGPFVTDTQRGLSCSSRDLPWAVV